MRISDLHPNPNFEHQHFAHCESGIMSTLLKYKGLELSEPMIFGLAGAICFAYLPFLKMGNMPLVSYRMFPGHIIKNITRRLGVEYFRKTYKDQDQAMAELDEFLADVVLKGGEPVWEKLFDKLGGFFNKRFGPDWKQRNQFFEDFEQSIESEK